MFDNSIVKIGFPVQETALNIARAHAQRRHALQPEHSRTQVLEVFGLALAAGMAAPLVGIGCGMAWRGRGVVCMVWRYGMDRCARRARTYAVV